MYFTLDFDIIIFMILVAFMIIGYITGAAVELIRLIKIYVPFIVVYYFAGPLSRWVYKFSFIHNIIRKVGFLQKIPYLNTFIMVLCAIIVFVGSYLIFGLIIKFIQKKLPQERVNYKLGKVSHILGAIIAVLRSYVIVSLLFLPFYLLNFATKDDISTNIIIKYPPPFTQIGNMVNSAEPIVTATTSVSTFFEVLDINQIKDYYDIVSNLPETLNNYEQLAQTECSLEPSSGIYPYLTSFINNSNACENETLEDVLPYKGIILWINNKNLDITSLTTDELIQKFNEDFDEIITETTDEAFKTKLISANEHIKIYFVVNNWLNAVLSGNNLLSDENIENIILKLKQDYEKKDSEGLFYELYQLNNDSLNEKLEVIAKFVIRYQDLYGPLMEKLNVDLSFKYKLIAATLKDINFLPTLERNPYVAMYIIDTLAFLDSRDVQLMDNESVYETFLRIMLPVYILTDENGNDKVLTAQTFRNLLDKICDDRICSLNQALDKTIVNEDFIIELIYSFTINDYGRDAYLQELIANGKVETDCVDVLIDYLQDNFGDHPKVSDILMVLGKEGEEDVQEE